MKNSSIRISNKGNMKLPTIGRPSVSGLSIKLIGSAEYSRQLRLIKGETKRSYPRWTGLKRTILGHNNYFRLYRNLVKNKNL